MAELFVAIVCRRDGKGCETVLFEKPTPPPKPSFANPFSRPIRGALVAAGDTEIVALRTWLGGEADRFYAEMEAGVPQSWLADEIATWAARLREYERLCSERGEPPDPAEDLPS